jgi:hypothetical protein
VQKHPRIPVQLSGFNPPQQDAGGEPPDAFRPRIYGAPALRRWYIAGNEQFGAHQFGIEFNRTNCCKLCSDGYHTCSSDEVSHTVLSHAADLAASQTKHTVVLQHATPPAYRNECREMLKNCDRRDNIKAAEVAFD